MKKILVILGTRPEIIRLSCVIKKLENNFKTVLVNSNQNFETNLNSIFFKNFNLTKPKYNLKKKAYRSSIEFIATFLKYIDSVIEKESPDAILLLGDTNTSLAALCGKKRRIPIFHMEAGNRCFDSRVPEEINRVLVDNLSDINLVYSDVAKQNLIKENFDLDKIIKIGSPLYEVYETYKEKINQSLILNKLSLKKDKYILVSCHREENVGSEINIKNILTALDYLSKKLKIKIVFSLHPRTKSKLNNIPKKLIKNINFYSPFDFFDYAKLQLNSKLVISDSGSIIEESNILNIPSINLRETTERQEGFEKGFSVMSGLDSKDIIESSEIVMKKFNNKNVLDIHPDYLQRNISDKIVVIIKSYIEYINRKVWFKKN